MSDTPKLDLPKSADQAIANATDKPTKEIGDIFNDLLYLVFGGVHFGADKRRIKYKYALEEFEKSCKEKIEAIPRENRVEPSTHIACQILEDAKYCVEDKDIREMYANLIASTMDDQTYNNVHPSFSVILKQMTPQDASFFKIFKEKSEIPVCNFRLTDRETSEYKILIEYAYIDSTNANIKQVQNTSFILSALERLGVVQILLNSSISNGNPYQIYENSDILKNLIAKYNTKTNKVEFRGGLARLTILGQHLLTVCCPDES